ncbi:phosphoglucan, water dikinase, chloroplastic, partial [Haematococcus lacustris]
MAIISWSITPPPETHAAMAQGPGQPAAEQERVVLVQLALPYKVDFGEVIKVSGNTPEFGSWDIEHAVQMHWTPGNVWVAELRLAPGTYEIKTWH